MATLFYAKVSSLNYKDGTANVTLQDRENQVIQKVPFLSLVYEMPKPGDTVAAILEERNGQIEKGVILGRIYLKGNKPKETGPGIFFKQFSDGEGVKYSPESKELELGVKKVVVEELIYEKITKR